MLDNFPQPERFCLRLLMRDDLRASAYLDPSLSNLWQAYGID
jgi:hypothetical protein